MIGSVISVVDYAVFLVIGGGAFLVALLTYAAIGTVREMCADFALWRKQRANRRAAERARKVTQ